MQMYHFTTERCVDSGCFWLEESRDKREKLLRGALRNHFLREQNGDIGEFWEEGAHRTREGLGAICLRKFSTCLPRRNVP